MEKLFGLGAYICLSYLLFRSGLTGFHGRYAIFAALGACGIFASYAAFYLVLPFLSIGAKRVIIFALRTRVFLQTGLNMLVRSLKRDPDMRRISYGQRLRNQVDAVGYLVRRNRALTTEIASLKAEVQSLNQDLLSVVENWKPRSVGAVPFVAPVRVVSHEVDVPVLAPFPATSDLDFVEDDQLTSQKLTEPSPPAHTIAEA